MALKSKMPASGPEGRSLYKLRAKPVKAALSHSGRKPITAVEVRQCGSIVTFFSCAINSYIDKKKKKNSMHIYF